MDQSQKISPHDRKLEPSNAVTDAAPYNEPTYSSNQGANDAEDVAGRLTPELADSSPSTSTSDVSAQPAPTPLNSSLYYDMTGDKFLIIFNHYQYKKWQLKEISEPSVRKGTYVDVKSLKRTFGNLGFTIDPHHDCTYQEIKSYVKEMCERDHSNTSCVAVAVMTHGLDTHLCAADTLYPVTDITDPLRTAPGLAGKPKLFFIQACREKHIKTPTNPDAKMAIPMSDDCLLLYSTYEDYLSYRNLVEGSWLMQALCEVIDSHHRSLHLTQMLTHINRKVAEKDVYYGKKNNFKQIPVTDCDFKKFLKF